MPSVYIAYAHDSEQPLVVALRDAFADRGFNVEAVMPTVEGAWEWLTARDDSTIVMTLRAGFASLYNLDFLEHVAQRVRLFGAQSARILPIWCEPRPRPSDFAHLADLRKLQHLEWTGSKTITVTSKALATVRGWYDPPPLVGAAPAASSLPHPFVVARAFGALIGAMATLALAFQLWRLSTYLGRETTTIAIRPFSFLNASAHARSYRAPEVLAAMGVLLTVPYVIAWLRERIAYRKAARRIYSVLRAEAQAHAARLK